MGNSASRPGATGSVGPPVPTGRAKGSDPPPGERMAAPGSRARQRADTHERIFETALREFREVGFAAAQIDRIAKQAGVARGTFYFHFPTKDDVMLELARRINARIVRRLGQIADAEPSLPDLLQRLSDALIEEHTRVVEAGLGADVLALYLRRPDDLRPLDQPTLSGELARQLQRIAETGQLDSPLPPDALAVVVMSSVFGVLARVPPGESLRQACSALTRILVRGLRVESGGPEFAPLGAG